MEHMTESQVHSGEDLDCINSELHCFSDQEISIKTTNSPLKTFPLFPKLAPELRDQIWELSLPGPRIIQLHADFDIWSLHLLSCPLQYFTVAHSTYGRQHPAILSVNRESRNAALRHLTERFHCYWNLKTDVPYIGRDKVGSDVALRNLVELDESMLEDLRSEKLLDGFKSLALDCGLWGGEQLKKWFVSRLRLIYGETVLTV
jgi:hypothetical protein